MSPSPHKTLPAAPAFRTIGLALLLPILLGACGFQPLYGEGGTLGDESLSTSVSQELSQVSVSVTAAEDVDGRGSGLVGFEARNQLIDLLDATQAETSKYTLRVALRGFRRGLAVQSDASVTRFNYDLWGRYELVENGSGKTLVAGTSRAFSAYNVVDSEFATVTARRDAEFRAARNIAENVKLQLALFFKSGGAWTAELEEEETGPDRNLPSYEKGNPRVPVDRPLGTPAPEDDAGDI